TTILLGLTSLSVPLLERHGMLDDPASAPRPTGDLLALVLGLCLVQTGAIFIVAPQWTRFAHPEQVQPWLAGYGPAICLAGLALVRLQIRPVARPAVAWAIHLVVGAVMVSFGLLLHLIGDYWPG